MARVFGARIPDEIASVLDQMVAQRGFETRSEFLRDELIRIAMDDKGRTIRVNACKQQNVSPGQVKSCPLLKIERLGHCAECPFQKGNKEGGSKSSDAETTREEANRTDPLDELMGHLSRNGFE